MDDKQNNQQEIDRATELITRAAGIDDTDLREHIRNSIIAVFNLVPGVGGSLASLLDEYIPSKKQERLIAFV